MEKISEHNPDLEPVRCAVDPNKDGRRSSTPADEARTSRYGRWPVTPRQEWSVFIIYEDKIVRLREQEEEEVVMSTIVRRPASFLHFHIKSCNVTTSSSWNHNLWPSGDTIGRRSHSVGFPTRPITCTAQLLLLIASDASLREKWVQR